MSKAVSNTAPCSMQPTRAAREEWTARRSARGTLNRCGLLSCRQTARKRAADDRGSRRIWPQLQAWRQPSALMGEFKTRDASRVINGDPGWIATRFSLAEFSTTSRRFLHPRATAAAWVRLSHINPSYNHDLRRSSMKRACQVPNRRRAKPRVLGYP
jgi:hypothetical protein